MVGNIDRKSSIDSEPRTLRMDQLHCAREAALYVLKTNSMEEAMSIFTEIRLAEGAKKSRRRKMASEEGLEPIISSAVVLKEGTLGIDPGLSEEFELMKTKKSHLENNNPELIRDVVTAPF